MLFRSVMLSHPETLAEHVAAAMEAQLLPGVASPRVVAPVANLGALPSHMPTSVAPSMPVMPMTEQQLAYPPPPLYPHMVAPVNQGMPLPHPQVMSPMATTVIPRLAPFMGPNVNMTRFGEMIVSLPTAAVQALVNAHAFDDNFPPQNTSYNNSYNTNNRSRGYNNRGRQSSGRLACWLCEGPHYQRLCPAYLTLKDDLERRRRGGDVGVAPSENAQRPTQ